MLNDNLILHLGTGWHVRLGPVLVSDWQPSDRSPWLESATTDLRNDDHEVIQHFSGWACRLPTPFTLSFAPPLSSVLYRIRLARIARRRRGPAGLPMTPMGMNHDEANTLLDDDIDQYGSGVWTPPEWSTTIEEDMHGE